MPPRRITVQPGPSATADLRAAVDRIAAEHGLSGEDRFALRLAATEALANALRHGSPNRGAVEVALGSREGAIEVEVRDRGTFRAHASVVAEGGRGLPLMVALLDELELAVSPEGTRVRMRKRIAPGREVKSRVAALESPAAHPGGGVPGVGEA